MDKSTLNKLKNIEERFFEIEKLMADQNNASDIHMITKLAKEPCGHIFFVSSIGNNK